MPRVKPSVLAVCLFSSPGAIADSFQTLCRSLASQSDLSVLTSDVIRDRDIPGAAARLYIDGPRFHPVRWMSPATWGPIREFVQRREFDLLFLYSEHPLHVPVGMLARARRTLFWCLDPKSHSGNPTYIRALHGAAKRALAARADTVVVACEALKRQMCDRYGVPPARVMTTFHGVLDNLIFPDVRPAPVRDIDVLFFGRLDYYKGLDVLGDAIRLLQARGRTPRVVIAGAGPYVVPPTPGATLDTRYLPDRELVELVARARIVVMPYHDATGSQVPQTAYSYGTPVVATTVGCLREYVEDGVTGLLVPPRDPARLADALELLLSDGVLWNSLSRNALDRAKTTFANEPLTTQLLARALS
ncbi:MAG: glycosyltransferase [Gemmatimonadetes bacterium]|nr:glycosyltransferase [Gemmatimonadota bacterium]